jgi:hypothetical protein
MPAKGKCAHFDGTAVIDAKRPLRIRVIKEDLASARRKDPGNCAIAQAVKRCAGVEAVRVHTSRVYVRRHKTAPWERYETPNSIRVELVAFDRGASFQEDEYVLPPPSKSHRIGMRETWKRRKKREAYTGKKRKTPHIFHGIRHHAPSGYGDKTTTGK